MSYFGIPIRNGLPIGLGSVAPLASGGGSPFSPLSLFSGGVPGAWYDPSDYSTLFQDSAGTTPVTAVEQPVGLMLDKSQGLVLGPELVPNGDFSNGSANWTTGTGWSISGGSAQGVAVAGADLSSSFITSSGRWYQFTFTITGYVAGIVRPSVGQSETINVTANGTYTYRFLAASPTAVKFFAFSGFTGSIDNISVKELAGNHAFQATSASRPVLKVDGNGKYYLKFDGVDDSLSTNSISFTSTDKMSVFAGVRKLSDAATAMIAETSVDANANNGAFYLVASLSGGSNYNTLARGTSSGYYVNTIFAAPVTNAVTLQADISQAALDTELIARFNGVVNQNSPVGTTLGVGNFGNWPLFIGRRNNATLPFNGQMYSMIIVGKAVTAGELSSTETFVATKTGVTL